MTEQKLYNIVNAAILSHSDILAKRHVASMVLDGDMTIFNKAAEDEAFDWVRTEPPIQAAVHIQKLSSLFWKDLQTVIPLNSITFAPNTHPPGVLPKGKDATLSRETAAYAKQVCELAFAAACFTGTQFLQLLSKVAYSVVAWGAAPVLQDRNFWGGRFVSLDKFAVSRDETSYVEFGYADPRELYAEYDALRKREARARALSSDDPLPENWKLAALERVLFQHLDLRQFCEDTPDYTIEQFVNFRTVYELCGSQQVDRITSRIKAIPIATVLHTDINGDKTLYILPHDGPVYTRLTPAEASAQKKRFGLESLVNVTAPKVIPSSAFAPSTLVSSSSSPSSHPDWPTLLYSKTQGESWTSYIEPQRNQNDSTVHNAHGAAYLLTKAYLSRGRDIGEFKARRTVAGSLTNYPNSTSSKPKVQRIGSMIATTLSPQVKQLEVNWGDYAATVALADQEIFEIIKTLDPQLSSLSRATTAEIAARGGAIQSQRASYASERAVEISAWLTNAYNSLLASRDYKSKPVILFWSILYQSLAQLPEFREAKDLDSFRPIARELLQAFELDVSFEDASTEILQARLRMSTDVYTKRRLEMQIRLVLGEDPATLVRSMVAPANVSEQVSSASVESYAISNGQFVPVEEGQNHWNHFLTHNAKVTEIVKTLQSNPNTDPVAAYTSLVQLGKHMADHRDRSREHPFYSQFVEQMEAALKFILQAVKQLAPAAQQEAQRAAAPPEAPPTDAETSPTDAETQAKLARQQASWEQRFKQRELQAQRAAEMREQQHALTLQIMTDKAAIEQQLEIATK